MECVPTNVRRLQAMLGDPVDYFLIKTFALYTLLTYLNQFVSMIGLGYDYDMKDGMIVVVDDEKIVTSAFKTLLMVEGYTNAHYFNNPEEALVFLQDHRPDLVISDFLMPQMNGLEFLKRVKEIHPEVSKIILTGYADKENAINAINEVGIYKYLEKPWSNEDLLINIRNGIERSYLVSELQKKIDELEVAKKELEKYSHSLEELVKEKTADIILTNSKLSGIITHCADGIVIFDEDGTIEQVNPAVENLTGLSENRLIGNDISEFIHHPKTSVKSFLDVEKSEIFLRDCYTTNPLSSFHIPLEISFARFSQEDDKPKYVCVLRDVTEQKKADRLRDDFIATLTHDLRTPLLAAIQTLKFFLDGSLGEITDRQSLLLSTMLKSNEDLLGLVNALLEVFRYDADKLVLQKSNFVFNELVVQVYNELKPLADKKELEFVLNDFGQDLVINADKTELRRVICNLCGNAINYTPQGGKVTMLVKAEENDLIFSVADNGSGIPQEDIPNLFQRFSQGTSAKRSTGTGLGLYLSRQIIEAHGGKIWLDSMLNKGSEFSFLLTEIIAERKEKGAGASI